MLLTKEDDIEFPLQMKTVICDPNVEEFESLILLLFLLFLVVVVVTVFAVVVVVATAFAVVVYSVFIFDSLMCFRLSFFSSTSFGLDVYLITINDLFICV